MKDETHNTHNVKAGALALGAGCTLGAVSFAGKQQRTIIIIFIIPLLLLLLIMIIMMIILLVMVILIINMIIS